MKPTSWRGKVIYFALIDRFRNGDKSNDDQGQGEYSPTDDDCFQGGDLQGLREKLPYLKRMGFDALWITPPVRNQWINPYVKTRGYHGYWAYDFTKVDPHFGTLDDYRALVRDAHELGIKVIQDIVVNHTGNFFTVSDKDYDPARPESNWKKTDDGPDDPVFRMNNPNVPEHKAAGVYNFTPNISDFRSREQTLTYAMGDLDDVNLKSPLAVERMKEIYRYWIEEVGVDGYRVDTVYYTPENFYEKFLHDEHPRSPGIKPFAERQGIKDFFVFGEVWSYDYKAIGRYLKGDRAERLDSAIDLPLNEALTQVFYRKAPTENLRKTLPAERRNHDLWVNFLDNHDVERMHARAAWPAVRQSLFALFTLPGIPCVYYGTEAGFTAARGNMFDDKNFDEGTRASKLLRRLIRFRKKHPALAAGRVDVERTSFSDGILSYTVTRGRDSYRMVFNTSSDRMIFEAAAGKPLLATAPLDRRGGTLLLPPESAYVFKAGSRERPARRAPGAGEFFALCDGDYDRKVPVPGPRAWKSRLDTRIFGNGRHRLTLLSRTKSGELRLHDESEAIVRNPYRLIAQAEVPEKVGTIMPPAEASYGGQLALRRVRALTSGRDLRLVVSMLDVTNAWNPPHGYDHVYFHVFFDFPGRPGKKFLPKLNFADGGFDFNAGFLLYGWGARSFAAKDSTPEEYGSPLLGEVAQAADPRRKTVTFTFPGRIFDALETFSGVKVLITTWDGYLGDLRGLGAEKADWCFSAPGADVSRLPKIYDRVLISL